MLQKINQKLVLKLPKITPNMQTQLCEHSIEAEYAYCIETKPSIYSANSRLEQHNVNGYWHLEQKLEVDFSLTINFVKTNNIF